MNLGGLARRVRRILGDDNGILISDQDIADWASDGLQEVVKRTQPNQEITTYAVAANDEEYPLDADVISVERVTLDGVRLGKTTLQEMEIQAPDRDSETSKGTPTAYYLWDGNIYLYPKPALAGTLKVWQNTLPSEITVYNAATVLDLPARYHESLVLFALHKAKQRDEDWTAADRFLASFEASLGEIIENESNPSTGSYPSIRPVEGDEW